MKRRVLSLSIGVFLFLTLAGPAPGAVGACGGELETIDGPELCREINLFLCERARARELMGEEFYQQCLQRELPACDSVPPEYCIDGIPPSAAAASLCMEALADGDTLNQRVRLEDFPECDLCS